MTTGHDHHPTRAPSSPAGSSGAASAPPDRPRHRSSRPASRASSSPTPPSATCAAPRASSTTASTRPSSWPSPAPSRTSGTSSCSGHAPRPVRAGRPSADRLAARRALPPAVLAALPAIAASGASPLTQLATGLAVAGGALGTAAHARPRRGRTASTTPSAGGAGAHDRGRPAPAPGRAWTPLEPDPSLGPRRRLPPHAHRRDATRRARARALDAYLVLTADHGFNASTFTGRVIASTGADLGACVVGALGALSGPLHGGAPSRALDLLDEIGDPARAAAVVEERLGRGERIMGFGHAVYVGEDPRSVLLGRGRGATRWPTGRAGPRHRGAVVEVLARLQARPRPAHQRRVLRRGGDGAVRDPPRRCSASTFAVSRTAGWCAHALEQAATRRLIRPSARYIGSRPRRPGPRSRRWTLPSRRRVR